MNASYSYIPLTNVEQLNKQENGFAINSPILLELLKNLSKEEHYEILDVLPANQGIIDLFSDFYCKLYLPGGMNQLSKLTSERYDTSNKLHRVFTKIFGFSKKRKASLKVLFLWDLPNYMEKNIMSELIEYLSQHMHESIKLHFYIYTKQKMPASAGDYSILPEGKVWLGNKNDSTVSSPLYFQESLQKLLSPFKVKRSMLLSNGLQEYVMELK